MERLVKVTFLRSMPPYFIGDEAGFPEAEVERLEAFDPPGAVRVKDAEEQALVAEHQGLAAPRDPLAPLVPAENKGVVDNRIVKPVEPETTPAIPVSPPAGPAVEGGAVKPPASTPASVIIKA